MATRTKMTPFARLLVVILIVAPLSYIGTSYYKGEDPLKSITELFSNRSDNTTTDQADTSTMSKADLVKKIEHLEMRISQLEQKIDILETTK